MLTSVAVIKEHVLTTTGMWVTVQDEDTPSICKGRQIIKKTKSRDMWTLIELKSAKNSAETRRNKIQTWNIQCKFYATTITCNSYIYHHYVLTCNMQKYTSGKVSTIQLSCINQYRLLVYSINICTNPENVMYICCIS